jgi:hypothetical protein
MATFNKDLSPIDQARIILRNYDKVVAERDELKKENERLNMLVEQKDVLYRNMLERMEAKNKQSAIEGEYKHLKKQYDNLNEEYEKLKGARYTVEVVKQLCGSLKAYGNQLRKAGLNIGAIEELFDSSAEEASNKDEPTKDCRIVYDKQTQNFIAYVRKIVDIFRKTGTLRGISVFAAQAGVTSISKEKFFLYGLDKEGELTDEEIVELYENVKKR